MGRTERARRLRTASKHGRNTTARGGRNAACNWLRVGVCMNTDTTGIATFDQYLAHLDTLNGNLLDTLIADAPNLAGLRPGDKMRLFGKLGELGVSDAVLQELRGVVQKEKRRKTNKTTEDTVSGRIKKTWLNGATVGCGFRIWMKAYGATMPALLMQTGHGCA